MITPDNLNLEENIKQLTLLALNKHAYISKAAAELGITEKTLYNYICTYNIKRYKNYTRGTVGGWHIAAAIPKKNCVT